MNPAVYKIERASEGYTAIKGLIRVLVRPYNSLKLLYPYRALAIRRLPFIIMQSFLDALFGPYKPL